MIGLSFAAALTLARCAPDLVAYGQTDAAVSRLSAVDADGKTVDLTKPFTAAGDVTVTVTSGKLTDSFTITVKAKTVTPTPGDNKPGENKPGADKPKRSAANANKGAGRKPAARAPACPQRSDLHPA